MFKPTSTRALFILSGLGGDVKSLSELHHAA
jgi:hypothetical protein